MSVCGRQVFQLFAPSLSYSLKASLSSVLIASESSSSSVINLDANVQKSSKDNVPVPVRGKKTACILVIKHLETLQTRIVKINNNRRFTPRFRNGKILILRHTRPSIVLNLANNGDCKIRVNYASDALLERQTLSYALLTNIPTILWLQ